jgi:hypothetical protein
MSMTIVFACKSNSCRSQMAEAWAKEWIKAERKELANSSDSDAKLQAFVDSLFVASVALDDTCVADVPTTSTPTPGDDSDQSARNESPTSSLNLSLECVTCNGEVCPLSARRRRPKEKAVWAMSHDGVDISGYEVKSFRDIFPSLLDHHRDRGGNINYVYNDRIIDMTKRNWRSQLLLPSVRDMLMGASREMGMAFAGISRNSIAGGREEEEEVAQSSADSIANNITHHHHVVDNLIVLCSCPESLTRPLAEVSKEMLNWDVDPPSTAAISEGEDVAFLRVSRQIRHQVYEFLNQLKSCAL